MAEELLAGKVGIVTGGGSGIGRATCLRFAAEGAKVVVADCSEEGGQATVAAIRDIGGEAHFVAADVGDEAQVEAMVAAAVAHFGALHIASNNAALARGDTLMEKYDMAHFRHGANICLEGVFLCLKHELAVMREAGGGAIVNIGSRASVHPAAFHSPYAAFKAGVNSLTRSAAGEYARFGVRVNCVNPGVTRTEGVAAYVAGKPELERALVANAAMARMGKPEELAEAVAWLCSDRASFVTGQSLGVDGGVNCKMAGLG